MNISADDSKTRKDAGVHVLVVDDELMAREAFGAMLEEETYEVSLASSGDEALKILARHSITVLCTDYRMPGMNGIELMARALSISPATISVLVTAYPEIISEFDDGNETKPMLLVKPFSRESMVDVLTQAAHFSKMRGLMLNFPDLSKVNN